MAYLVVASPFGTPAINVYVLSSLGVSLVLLLAAGWLVRRRRSAEQARSRERRSADVVSRPGTQPVRGGTDRPPRPAQSARGEQRRILVVDDNATMIRFVERALSDTYVVCSAKNGREALTSAEQDQPDLIISDVMMPEMNGHELCRKLKDDPALRHIPVVLLTALATQSDLVEGLELGSDDYIFKPFDTRELKARVRNLIAARDEQRRLARENDELTTACATKTELLSHAAHDLKNPLTAIRELAEIVKDEVGPQSEAFQPAQIIHRSSDQMLHVISSLLESAAMEDGRIPLNLRPIDLACTASDVVRRNDALARRKGQTIELRTVPGESSVLADEGLLFEAMDNLVNNAIKYSPRNGAIRVQVAEKGERVRFSVTDNGPGLSEEDQGRLFQKFERLSPRPTGGESSTGLGLAIVKQIVELHDGLVEVRSAPGEGSTFAIELSRVETDGAMLEKHHQPGTPGERKY